MLQKIKLEKLYTKIKDQFSQYIHDERKFVDYIIKEFRKDPIRTKSVVQDLSSQQLNFRIHRHYPLNDFLHGSLEYMTNVGIKKQNAEDFIRSLSGNVLFHG